MATMHPGDCSSQDSPPPIAGAFYIEFDNNLGPKLCAQHPENTFTPELLGDVGDYVIPKPECCGNLLSFEAGGMTIVGHPMQISGNKYARNNFFFNVGFIFDSSVECMAYNTLVAKLARYFQSMEEESGYLTSETEPHCVDEILRQATTTDPILPPPYSLYYHLVHGSPSDGPPTGREDI